MVFNATFNRMFQLYRGGSRLKKGRNPLVTGGSVSPATKMSKIFLAVNFRR